MPEILAPVTNVFPNVPTDQRGMVADNTRVIAVTHGDDMACRICHLHAPIGVRQIMAAPTIEAIHTFIAENATTHDDTLSHHNQGQVTDFEDAGWNAGDVIIDGLRTGRYIEEYIHGIDPGDERALEAIKKLHGLPPSDQRRLHVVVSSDPYGPCNFSKDEAPTIGRLRVRTALEALKGLPNVTLRVMTVGQQDRSEVRLAIEQIGCEPPDQIESYQIKAPTRSPIPEIRENVGFNLFYGFQIGTDGTVTQKIHPGPGGQEVIGTLQNIDLTRLRRPLSTLI